MRLVFDPQALEDLHYWTRLDKKKAAKILELIQNTIETPFSGLGKPEALKYEYAGFWSCRIDQEHRMVYKVENNELIVISCRYHYG